MNADVEVEADRLCGEVANNVALSPETVAMKMRIKSLKQTPVHAGSHVHELHVYWAYNHNYLIMGLLE